MLCRRIRCMLSIGDISDIALYYRAVIFQIDVGYKLHVPDLSVYRLEREIVVPDENLLLQHVHRRLRGFLVLE